MKQEDPVALSLLSRSIRTYSPSSASHGIPQRPKLTTATLTALAPAGGTLPDAPEPPTTETPSTTCKRLRGAHRAETSVGHPCSLLAQECTLAPKYWTPRPEAANFSTPSSLHPTPTKSKQCAHSRIHLQSPPYLQLCSGGKLPRTRRTLVRWVHEEVALKAVFKAKALAAEGTRKLALLLVSAHACPRVASIEPQGTKNHNASACCQYFPPSRHARGLLRRAKKNPGSGCHQWAARISPYRCPALCVVVVSHMLLLTPSPGSSHQKANTYTERTCLLL